MNDELEGFVKKRQQYTIQIRKQTRDQILSKRRNLMQSGSEPSQIQQSNEQKSIIVVDNRFYNQIQSFMNTEYDDSMFDQLAAYISSSDLMEQHRGIIGMRKLLARNVDPPIKRFIDKGLVNKCLWLAQQKQNPQLKLQSAWILTNVASGQSKFCQKIVQRNGIQLFINLLRENEKGIVDQAIWGIGNIAADNVKFRDAILKVGGMKALIDVMQKSKNNTIVRNGAWAITNLCRGLPVPQFKYLKQACPVLCKVIKSKAIKSSNNKEILSDITWAICYMTEGSKSRLQRVLKQEILPQIFELALDNFNQIYVPALKIIGNFSTGNQNHVGELINNGIFRLAMKILDHPKKPMRKQMLWILSNVVASVETHIQAFLRQTDLLQKIAIMFYQDVVQIKRQICWIYGNMGLLISNRAKIIQLFMQYDIIRIFVNLLNQEDGQTLENVLQTLYKVLFVGKKFQINNTNILLIKFCQYGGAEKLQTLQMHQNKAVYEQVIRILSKFFELEQEGL